MVWMQSVDAAVFDVRQCVGRKQRVNCYSLTVAPSTMVAIPCHAHRQPQSPAWKSGVPLICSPRPYPVSCPCWYGRVLLNRRQKEAEERADAAEGQLNKLQTEMQTARDVSKGWRVLSFFPPEVLSRRLHGVWCCGLWCMHSVRGIGDKAGFGL